MSYLTLEDLAKLKIKSNAPIDNGSILKDIIEEHEDSEEKKVMDDGENYFRVNNDIEKEDFRIWYDEHGLKQIQKNKANNRLAHGFVYRIVSEKEAYLLKTPITITHKDTALVGKIFDTINREMFDEILSQWVVGASTKRREWLHPFINEKQEFDLMIFDARQIVPVFEKSRQKYLQSAIRYYPVKTNEAGDVHERWHVEWYHSNRVDIYEENHLGIIEFIEKKHHFKARLKLAGTEANGSWGRTPLVELRNNSWLISDLEIVKSLIDAYDRSQSEFTNNLEDIQEAITHVSGTSDTPQNIRNNLKKYKVAVSEDGEGKMVFLSVEIPHEARQQQLKDLEENIYTYGMSINPKTDKFGEQPSGVALQRLYLPLDLKAGRTEMQLKKSLRELFWFFVKYGNLTGKYKGDPDIFEFTLNKTMITNETEQIDNFVKMRGHVSDETADEHCPWIKDPEEEAKRRKKDAENETKVNLGDEDEEDQNN